MEIPLDEVVLIDVITSHPTTGAVTDADSTPTFAVYEETTDTDIGVGGNLTKRTSLTGNYRGQFTASAANGFELGKFYSVVASATVNSIAGKCVVRTFRVVAAELVAGYRLNHIDTDVAAIKAKTDNLPADPADASDVAAAFSTVNSTLATLAAYVDTEVAAIKAKTDNLPAAPAAAGDIPSAASIASLVAAGAVASVTGAVGSVTAPVTAGTVTDKTGYSLLAGQIGVKKNVALANFGFVMVDFADAPLTGLTVTATRSIDGAAFGACANSVAEISAGAYKIDLAAADLNGNAILLKFTATGAKTRFVLILTQP